MSEKKNNLNPDIFKNLIFVKYKKKIDKKNNKLNQEIFKNLIFIKYKIFKFWEYKISIVRTILFNFRITFIIHL